MERSCGRHPKREEQRQTIMEKEVVVKLPKLCFKWDHRSNDKSDLIILFTKSDATRKYANRLETSRWWSQSAVLTQWYWTWRVIEQFVPKEVSLFKADEYWKWKVNSLVVEQSPWRGLVDTPKAQAKKSWDTNSGGIECKLIRKYCHYKCVNVDELLYYLDE